MQYLTWIALMNFRMWHLRPSTQPFWNTLFLASSHFFKTERCNFFKRNQHRCGHFGIASYFYFPFAEQFELFAQVFFLMFLKPLHYHSFTMQLHRKLDLMPFTSFTCSAIKEVGAWNHPSNSYKWAPSSTHEERSVCDVPFSGGIALIFYYMASHIFTEIVLLMLINYLCFFLRLKVRKMCWYVCV